MSSARSVVAVHTSFCRFPKFISLFWHRFHCSGFVHNSLCLCLSIPFVPFIHIVPCYLFSLPSASPLTSPPSVNPLGLFLGLGSPLEASGSLARSIKMPKRIHWWLMSPGEWEGDQGIIVYILRNNLIRPRPSRLVSCFLHGASCHLTSLSVRSFAVTSILAPSLPPWGLLSRPRVLSLVQ